MTSVKGRHEERLEPASRRPYKFGLTSFVGPNAYAKECYLNCEAVRSESLKLCSRLFREHVVLRQAVESDLALHLERLVISCFEPLSQFDHAVCLLRLNTLGVSRFLIETSFYKDTKLVARTYQKGRLVEKKGSILL